MEGGRGFRGGFACDFQHGYCRGFYVLKMEM